MGSASYTKRKFRATNGHEWKIQSHEWTRMDTKRKFRATNGHEWNHEIQEWNHETHEIHERKIQNHEWTRMDTKGKFRTTNGHEQVGGTTKHTKGAKGKFRTTNGHEWARKEPRNTGVEPRNTRKTRKKAGGIV